MIEIMFEHLKNIKYLGLVINESKHDNAESILKLCMLEKIVKHDIGVNIFS